uniref:F-box domain-containing protein n=1 Tax=Chrysotila carterae TaxID=13221 RepID=A0A7S4C1Y5_CHRCT
MVSLLSLPHEVLVKILQQLPPSSFAAFESSCSLLWSIAADVWYAKCTALWPHGPNLGVMTQSARVCYACANGWMHLPRLPQTVVAAASDGNGRRSAGRCEIWGFDATDDILVAATRVASCSKLNYMDLPRARAGKIKRIYDITFDAHHAVEDVAMIPSHHTTAAVCIDGDAHPRLLCCPTPTSGAHHHQGWHTIWRGDSTSASTVGAHELSYNDARREMIYIRNSMGWRAISLATGQDVHCHSLSHIDMRCTSLSIDSSQPCLLVSAWRRASSPMSFIDVRDDRTAADRSTFFFRTRHNHVCQVVISGAYTALVSHARSRNIEEYDLRRVHTAMDQGWWRLGCGITREWGCGGNAPDFDVCDGILVATSTGRPGTGSSPKLQVFNTSTASRQAVDRLLTEIVNITPLQSSRSSWMKLTRRSVTFGVSPERLMHCWIPDHS